MPQKNLIITSKGTAKEINGIKAIEIKNHPKYFILADGRVWSERRGKFLKISIGNTGYPQVGVYYNGKAKILRIHRLVAENMIPNPENKKEVNHVNAIKTDARIENLEWCTPKENIAHSIKTGRKIYASKKVINVITGKVYESYCEAAKCLNISHSHLYKMLSGDMKNNTSLSFVGEEYIFPNHKWKSIIVKRTTKRLIDKYHCYDLNKESDGILNSICGFNQTENIGLGDFYNKSFTCKVCTRLFELHQNIKKQ